MKDIPEYESLYSITEDGKIWSYHSNKWLKPSVSVYGYHLVSLSKNGRTKSYRLHRLVATVFVENPNNYTEVNHLDSNRLNNNAGNLEWCTHQMNMLHSYRFGNKQHWTRMKKHNDWRKRGQVWKDTDLKYCKQCKTDKYTTEFYRNNKVNLATICKPCYREKYFNKL